MADKELSLKQRLATFLKRTYPTWHASGDLQRMVMAKTSYTARTAVRRLEELTKEGLLHVGYRERHHAWYRWNPDSHKVVAEEVAEPTEKQQMLMV